MLRSYYRLFAFSIAASCIVAPAVAVEYRLITVAEGLEHPWSIAFLPRGDLLVTERAGRLRLIRDGVLDPDPITGVPSPFVRSQAGLFDVLLHPSFENNGLLYLSYAHGDAGSNATRVVRARLEGHALTALQVIFEVAPRKSTPVHFGGRMLFLPDGTLLVTTGDGFVHREQAQNLASLLGKVVRLNDDGSVPADNPFVDRNGARPEIWAYGLRNPQGIALHGAAGRVFVTDHGPRGGDEFHALRPGRNYGWPLISYGLDYTGARVTPFTELRGLEQPLHYWETAIAPAALAWYHGEHFPRWRGAFLFAALAGRSVRRVTVDGEQAAQADVLFEELGERIRDVRVSPDSALYILTDSPEGRVIRVSTVTPDGHR
jgi:aldose sugar dehydrogenase